MVGDATRLGRKFGVKWFREQHHKGRPQKYNNYNLSSEAPLVVGGWVPLVPWVVVGSFKYSTPNIDIQALFDPKKVWKFTLGHFKPKKIAWNKKNSSWFLEGQSLNVFLTYSGIKGHSIRIIPCMNRTTIIDILKHPTKDWSRTCHWKSTPPIWEDGLGDSQSRTRTDVHQRLLPWLGSAQFCNSHIRVMTRGTAIGWNRAIILDILRINNSTKE